MSSIGCRRNIHLIPSLPLCSIIWAPAPPLSFSLFLKIVYLRPLSGFHCCVRAFSMLTVSSGYSLAGVSGLLVTVGGFSCCGAPFLEHNGSVLSTAWPEWLCGTWDLPGPGIEPTSPALQGRFLTPGPPGTSLSFLSLSLSCFLFFFFSAHGRSINHENMDKEMQILTKFPGHFQEDGQYRPTMALTFSSLNWKKWPNTKQRNTHPQEKCIKCCLQSLPNACELGNWLEK